MKWSPNIDPKPVKGGLSYDVGTWKTLEYENVCEGVRKPINIEDRRFLILDGYMEDIIRRIEGRILTVVEASTDDKEKREAVKAIVRQAIWNEAKDIRLLQLERLSE